MKITGILLTLGASAFLSFVANAADIDIAVNLDFQTIEADLLPNSQDPTCQVDLLCTSFQVIEGSTIGPIGLRSPQPVEFFFSFNGNYNCNDCDSPPSLFPFVDVQLLVSTNGGPLEPIAETSNYVPNSGADTVLRHAIELGRGLHTLQLRHRYQVFTNDPEELDLFLGTGAVRLEQLN